MSVIAEKTEEGKLHLIIDEKELTVFNEQLLRWNFKNEQALIRFALSILSLSEDTKVDIVQDGSLTPVIPSDKNLKYK